MDETHINTSSPSETTDDTVIADQTTHAPSTAAAPASPRNVYTFITVNHLLGTSGLTTFSTLREGLDHYAGIFFGNDLRTALLNDVMLLHGILIIGKI